MRQASSQFLKVSSLHTVRIQLSGNPNGIPLVLLHGGPGMGINLKELEAYDPTFYHIITFDQRGAGQSMPAGETRENTTADLIEDINKICNHLAIQDFILAGGSWGTTLALLYAQQYPKRIKGLVLRATDLARKEEMDWIYGPQGACTIFPDHWKEFTSILPMEDKEHVVGGYEKLLNNPNPSVQTIAASMWNQWPPATNSFTSYSQSFKNTKERDDALNYSKIGVHYFKRDFFIKENQILLNLDIIKHIPIQMVHGEKDMIVPVKGAVSLKDSHPLASLTIVKNTGHSITEPDLFSALSKAANSMKTLNLFTSS